MRLVAAGAAAALLTVLPAVPSLGQQPPGITSLGSETLTVKALEGKDTASAYVPVLNSSNREIRFRIGFEAATSESISVAGFSPRIAARSRATRVKVTLRGLSKLERTKAEGQLVLRPTGAAPVARAVSITPAPQPNAAWPTAILFGAAVAFVLLLVFGCIVGRATLFKPAPGPKWSFDSWGTTLTAAGGIFGTVVGEATLPEVPLEIGKETLVRLSILFGALVVVGPFVFGAIRNPKASDTDQESGFTGWNFTLLIACSVTAAAVVGQLATLGLLGWEIVEGGLGGVVLVAGAGLLLLMAAYYFVITVGELVQTDWDADAASAKEEKAKPQFYGVVLTNTTAEPDQRQEFELALAKLEPPPDDKKERRLAEPVVARIKAAEPAGRRETALAGTSSWKLL